MTTKKRETKTLFIDDENVAKRVAVFRNKFIDLIENEKDASIHEMATAVCSLVGQFVSGRYISKEYAYDLIEATIRVNSKKDAGTPTQ